MARSFVNAEYEPEWLRQAGDPNQWMQFEDKKNKEKLFVSVRFSKGMIRKDQVVIAKEEFGKLKRIVQVIGKEALEIEGLQKTLTD